MVDLFVLTSSPLDLPMPRPSSTSGRALLSTPLSIFRCVKARLASASRLCFESLESLAPARRPARPVRNVRHPATLRAETPGRNNSLQWPETGASFDCDEIRAASCESKEYQYGSTFVFDEPCCWSRWFVARRFQRGSSRRGRSKYRVCSWPFRRRIVLV